MAPTSTHPPLPPLALQPPDLPPPPAADQARAGRLLARLRERIRAAGGWLPFEDYMEAALYAPGLGYYAAGEPVGETGDFVTAPELSPLFGACLAECVAAAGAQLGSYDILEVGPGRGTLAADLLNALARRGQPPRRYQLLELSPALRARQAAVLAERAPAQRHRVHWLDRLPEAFTGVVLANEVLDAMPVTRIRMEADGIRRLGVAWQEGGLAACARPAPAALAQRIGSRLAGRDLPVPYETEILLQAEAWVRSVAERLDSGMLLLIDYGFPRREFYHPQRDRGTLMCHYRHRAHTDPLVLPGLQDITTHVEFTAIAEAGAASGLALLGYTHQAAFLLDCGLVTQLAALPAGTRAQLEATAAVKRLTLPSEMGELFKVMALGRGLSGPVPGFRPHDQRHRL